MTGRLFEDPTDEPIVPSRGFPYGKFENKEPLARSTDPSTSHAAAKAVTESGQRDSQKAKVLRALQNNPRMTSQELAGVGGFDRYMVARRLPDLERDGMVRKAGERACNVSGTPAVIWEAI
jgi:predicted HTH transcriptional regulator